MKHTINNHPFCHQLLRGVSVPESFKMYMEFHRPDIVELEKVPTLFCPRIGTGNSKLRISNRIY